MILPVIYDIHGNLDALENRVFGTEETTFLTASQSKLTKNKVFCTTCSGPQKPVVFEYAKRKFCKPWKWYLK